MTQYRSDIDGLRAVAVGGVVVFHAVPNLLPGGFIGVDVFFVLSGFLITSIIRTEAESNRFSIATFYERRFRRIIPALLAMLIVTSIASIHILPPFELAAYGKSLIGVAVFVSNIIFWSSSGYFDTDSIDKPLLHTWSLAVEEQFYIFWPLIAAFLISKGRPRTLGLFVIGMVVCSLAASIIMVKLAPSQAFYLLPYRAWELGFGALLAVGAVPAIRQARWRESLACIGLLLIVIPMFLYSEKTPFPGLAAIPPCLGTLLLIHSGQGYSTAIGRSLSLRWILFTGLISYSLYLWHWPILVLSRIALNRPLLPWEAFVALAAAYALGALSLRFVEKPFRGKGTIPLSRRSVLVASASVCIMTGAIGLTLWATHGFRAYASPSVQIADAAIRSVNPRRSACHSADGVNQLNDPSRCIGGNSSKGNYSVLLWGDSHADHLMPGMEDLGRLHGFAVRQATVSGCTPLVIASEDGRQAACRKFHQAALAEAAQQPNLKAVVISMRWSTSLPEFTARDRTPAGTAKFKALVVRFEDRVRQFVGHRVKLIFVGSTPEFTFWPATCFARAAQFNRDITTCQRSPARDGYWGEKADGVLSAISLQGTYFVLPRDFMCRPEGCVTYDNGSILYRDDDHLTNAGSRFVTRRLRSLLVAS